MPPSHPVSRAREETRLERAALASSFPFASSVAEEFEGERWPSVVRLNAKAMRGALDDLAEKLDRRLLSRPEADSSSAFKAYARDHMRELP